MIKWLLSGSDRNSIHRQYLDFHYSVPCTRIFVVLISNILDLAAEREANIGAVSSFDNGGNKLCWKCNFSAFEGNDDRPTNQPIIRLEDS